MFQLLAQRLPLSLPRWARPPRVLASALCALLLAAVAVDAVAQVPAFDQSRVIVQGTGEVEVFVNGRYIGRSAEGSRLNVQARHLQAGENVLALRATTGGAATPTLLAELAGRFGRLGTSSRWRVQPVDATDQALDWAQPGYDDSGWIHAAENGDLPPTGFPADGPARQVWSNPPAGGKLRLRAALWLPAADVRAPQGMAAEVTGGYGGEVVVVSSREALAHELCRQRSGNTCTDDAPRIVKVQGLIDFTGSEGTEVRSGCVYRDCPAPYANERLISNDPNGHCSGRPIIDITIDSAGNRPLLVGSNKTLVGLGNDAVVRGKGLSIRNGMSNIVVRNLSFEKINQGIIFAGDAISIDNASRIWIDHNRFNRIGRQMIVTGYGRAEDVTISWNDFDGTNENGSRCDGRHYWNLMFLGDHDRITLSNNWLRKFSGRAPKIGDGANVSLLHLAGNYFEDGGWHALDPAAPARVLVEGNVFQDIPNPIMPGAGNVWASRYPPQASHQQHCRERLGRDCVGNQVQGSQPDWANFRNDLVVLGDFEALLPPNRHPQPEAVEGVSRMVPFLAGPGHLGADQLVWRNPEVFVNSFEDDASR